MFKKFFFGASFVVFLLSSISICPQDIFDQNTEEEITLVTGEAYVFNVSFPQRVSMRNPEIADISKVSDKEIVIVAKQQGDTTLTVWNKEGEKTYYITVYAQDLDRVKTKLDKLIRKDLKVTNAILKKNESTGKIIISGDVSAVEYDQIAKVLEPFKNKVDNILTVKKETKMVEIEARILELNKTDLDNIGVQWMQSLQIRQEPYIYPTGGSSGGVDTTLNVQKPWEALWGMGSWSRDALTAKINLLIETGKGKELSRPKLLCLSGEEAKLTVGGEVPYLSGSTTGAAGTTTTISYKEYGVILKIRPIVSRDNKKIYASMRAEVSALDLVNAITVNGVRIPAFTTRIAETVLNLRSGDTVFIAGLIKNKDTETIDKFPALANLPVLGQLFKSKNFQNNQTELVISLTPRVILDDDKEVPEVKEANNVKNTGLYTGILPDALQGYISDVQKQISDNITYPSSLVNTGWEGMVVLKLSIDQAGNIKDVKVSKSSGHKIFDNEAVRLVNSLTFPPFPPDVDTQVLNIDVPIVYREKIGS